jgi:pimeloyl-ACP methyl ester carboxylesterase
MPYLTAADGIRLYFEETGTSTPIVFIHEYAGDYRSWEPQVRYFSRRYRCITFSARGYPPSDVPNASNFYSQDIVRDDVKALIDRLKLDKAHIVGHSMGAYTALHVGIRYPEVCLSLTAAGCGWGSNPDTRSQSIALATEIGEMFRKNGIEEAAAKYADFAMRSQYKAKDPRGWEVFKKWMGEHSSEGHAFTMLNVQVRRPTLWDMEGNLRKVQIPTLIVVGDEDEACIEGSVMLKRAMPQAALLVIPRSGHTINSEEPAVFNQALLELFTAVQNGRWMAHRLSSPGHK